MPKHNVRTLFAAALLLLAASPGTARAQWLAAPATAPAPVVRVAGSLAAVDSASCFDCDPRPKRFALASAQLVAVMVIPWSVNKFVRGEEFANVSPETWWDNITGEWVWDDNSFLTNQFAHPYHGSLYFNAFRSNGYGFWQSSIASAAGAFLWECCGETNPIAPNDLINTAIGGISLGEMLYRISSRVLDNTATGAERTWREIGGFVVNPQRGASRVFHGTVNDVGPNGPERSPSRVGGALDLGYQSIQGSGATDTSESGGLIRFDYRYGDAIADLAGRPFSTFAFELNVITDGVSPRIEEAFTHGSLAGRMVGDPDSPHRHALGAILNYDYSNNPAYEVGMQSLTAGLLSDWRLSPQVTLHTEALARGIILAGIKSPEYIVTGEGRDYDYGPGVGGRLDATLQVRGVGSLRAGYELNWITAVNGTDGDHTLGRGLVRARVEISDRFGVGAGWKQRRIHSRYASYPDDIQDVAEYRFFVSTAVPRWDF
jgi:hypothetical protein